MSWIAITENDVLTRLSGAEKTPLTTAAAAPGQVSPLPDIIASVTARVRGYVAACPRNRLGAAGTIPARLLGPALAVIRHEIATRLPGMTALLDEARVREYHDAIKLLEQVAACDFAVDNPAADGDTGMGGALPSSRRRRLQFDRRSQDGI